MTQALNLALLANNVNSSGQLANAGLQNSSVTVTAGTGLSGGGSVALGGTISLANAGVTSLAAGSGISLSGSTGAITISVSAAGTVTSVATGNGLTGGPITGSGTISIAAPTALSVGSYCILSFNTVNPSQYCNTGDIVGTHTSSPVLATSDGAYTGASLTGSWRWLGPNIPNGTSSVIGLAVRVS